VRVGSLELSRTARTVLQNGMKIDLTDVEFSLLEALMQSPGNVVTREEISENVLGENSIHSTAALICM